MEKYSEELAINILERMAQGEPLLRICKDEGYPTRISVLRWRHNPDLMVWGMSFKEAYELAQEDQAEYYGDLINEDALNAEEDVKKVAASEGTDKKVINALVQARRLKIDSLKWTASKLKPKRYGDKLELGGSKDNPVTVKIINYGGQDEANPDK